MLRFSDWLRGFSAATWLFLPIAAASLDSKPIMMWHPRHTYELLAAWVISSAVFAACVRTSRSQLSSWTRGAAIAFATLPVGLTVIDLNARWVAAHVPTATAARWTLLGLGTGLAALLAVAVLRRAREAADRMRGFLSVSSVLVVPFWLGVVHLQTDASRARPEPPARANMDCPDIDVLVFDELSYAAVFANGEATRASLEPLVGSATVYDEARAPATVTLRSIASYLSDIDGAHAPDPHEGSLFDREDGNSTTLRQILRSRGLFYEAKARGYRTEVLGWFFPYCEELGDLADACHEFSMYNAATADGAFSIWSPFLTLANMWPYQWPTGLAKRPAARWLHAAELDGLLQLVARPSNGGPTLRWTHVNVPHRPWIAAEGAVAADTFDPSPQKYRMQLAQVDRTVASLLERARASGRFDREVIVLTSDHGARDGMVGDDILRVPLIVRVPGETGRHNIHTPVKVRRVLNDLVSASCGKI